MKLDFVRLQRDYKAPVSRDGTVGAEDTDEHITIVSPKPLIREIRAQSKCSDYFLVDTSSGHDDYGYAFEVRRGDVPILRTKTIYFKDERGCQRFDVGFDLREVNALVL